MKKQKLGVDCGNVILEQMNGTPIEGALIALRQIVQAGIFSDVYIVSKCGPRVQALTRNWLEEVDFWNFTGISERNLEFCLKFFEKQPICQRLGITHFIDDRPRVLNCLISVENLYAFSPVAKDMAEYRQSKPLMIVRSWDEVLQLML